MVLLHHPNLALPLRETIPITLLSRSPFDGSSFPTIPDKTTGHPGRSCKGHGNLKLSSGHGSHYTSLTLSFIASANGSAPFYGISPPVSSSYNTTYPCLDIDPDLCPSGEPIEVSVSEMAMSHPIPSSSSSSPANTVHSHTLSNSLWHIKHYSTLPPAGPPTDHNLNLMLGSLARYDGSGNAVLLPSDCSLLVDTPMQTT